MPIRRNGPMVATLLTLGLVTLGMIVGCGNQNSGETDPMSTHQPTTPAGTTPITITRTGGFAGVNQAVEITNDGSWVYTDRRQNTSERGTLTADQQATLRALAETPGLAQELTATQSPGNCADTFVYEIQVGSATGRYDECDRQDRPAVAAILAAVDEATPL